jgi:hypothetical protein
MGAILTYTGKSLDPLSPDPDAIVIEDIAHALSNICRYTGHVRRFYSVAEHAFRVSFLVPDQDRMWGLLHDASEAYIGDVARPIKRMTSWYSDVEDALMEVICLKFGLPYGMPESVHTADNDLLVAEARALMPESDDPRLVWPRQKNDVAVDPDGLGWLPSMAEVMFLSRYNQLRKVREAA